VFVVTVSVVLTARPATSIPCYPFVAAFNGIEALRLQQECEMSCKLCQSSDQHQFSAEINIHPSGYEGGIFVFPRLVVCLNCGFTEFSLRETELRLLAEHDSSAA
jgi:hypothetical protein